MNNSAVVALPVTLFHLGFIPRKNKIYNNNYQQVEGQLLTLFRNGMKIKDIVSIII